LNELVKLGLIKCSSSQPKNYFIDDFEGVLSKRIELKKNELEKEKSVLLKSLAEGNDKSKEFKLRLNEFGEFSLINVQTKLELKDRHLIRELRKKLEEKESLLIEAESFSYSFHGKST